MGIEPMVVGSTNSKEEIIDSIRIRSKSIKFKLEDR